MTEHDPSRYDADQYRESDHYDIAFAHAGSLPDALKSLRVTVNEMIGKGWEPTGGITIERLRRSVPGPGGSVDMETTVTAIQALVR